MVGDYIYSFPNPNWGGPPVVQFRREPSIEEMNDELRQCWASDEPPETNPFTLEIIAMQRERIENLESAIRNHRDERGDDRCWMDDETLYKVLPEGYTAPARDSSVEIEKCVEYIKCRQNPATEYVSPQRRIEELEQVEEVYLKRLHALEQKVAYLDKHVKIDYPSCNFGGDGPGGIPG